MMHYRREDSGRKLHTPPTKTQSAPEPLCFIASFFRLTRLHHFSCPHGLVGMTSLLWRWQTASGSIPRWSVSKTQDRLPAESQQVMETTITSLQRTDLLSGIISEQDLRTLRTACLCILYTACASESRPELTHSSVQWLINSYSLCKQLCNHTLLKIFALLTQAALLEALPNISLKPSALGDGALRLQVCVNAVKFAIR